MTTQPNTTLFKINLFKINPFKSDLFRTTFFKRVWRIPPVALALGLACMLTVILMETVLAAGATFTVSNTNDGGPGSLRQAIEQANANGNPNDVDTIQFNISGTGVQTISPTSALPAITDPVTIDGTTQPGFLGSPIVELNGASAGSGVNGLKITAGSSTVRGLVINRFFGSGVRIEGSGASGNLVQGNYIGTDADGTLDRGNSLNGVYIFNAKDNFVGGAGARNVISGNDFDGVLIDGSGASGNRVQGNYIGTDTNGTADRGNTRYGVYIPNAHDNFVGGTDEGTRNVISGNNANGVYITGSGTTRNQVQGNYIGTNAAGTGDLGNSLEGVYVANAPGNIVGGTETGARNVVSGNDRDGVVIFGSSSSGNQVQGNYVGTGANGTADLGNTSRGVYVNGAPNNVVGGTETGARNVISGNDFDGVSIVGGGGNKVQGNYIGTDANGTAQGNSRYGVLVSGGPGNTIGGAEAGAPNVIAFNSDDGVNLFGTDSTGNPILSNSIFSNGGLGIDLQPNGVTANDQSDPDTGPNKLQNFPVLTSVTGSGGTTTVNGTLNSTPNTTYTLQFFSSPGPDPSGNGEGKTYLGQKTDVTTDGLGNVSFTFTTTEVPTGEIVTATATSSGNDTSEFSKATDVKANTAPVANGQSVAASEDTAKTIILTGTDADGHNLTFGITSGPTNGTLGAIGPVTCMGTASKECRAEVTYNPGVEFSGSDSFDFRVNDGATNSSAATVSITVAAVNDAPDAVDDTASAEEDVTLDIAASSLLTNDTDVENDTLTITEVSDPANGTATLSSDGQSISYLSDANYNGNDSFTYTVDDGNGGTDTATVAITVTAVNDAPVAEDDAASTDEDTELAIPTSDLLANDDDVDNDSLTVSQVSDPANGTATLSPDGQSISYEPDLDYNGSDSFDYAIDDGNGGAGTATVTITVNAVNDAPVANDDAKTTPEDTPLVFPASDLLANDSEGPPDESGQTLTVTEVSNPVHGTVELESGNVTFTPDPDYNGPASFEYTVCDSGSPGKCSVRTATVEVTVNPTNDDPVADDETTTTNEDTAVVIDVKDGDTPGPANESGQGLSVTNVTNPAHGTARIIDTGTDAGKVRYAPDGDYNGPDSFEYTVCDDGDPSRCDTATVNVTVNPVNDNPVATNDEATTNEDTPIASIDVLANDSDVDGSDTLSVGDFTQPSHGAVTQNPDGTLKYDALEPDFNGTDSFTYKANDGTADSNVATVTIAVNAVNAAPTISDIGNQSTDEDTPTNPVTFAIGDAETAAGSLSVTGSSSNTTLVPNANIQFGGSVENRTVTVAPASNQSGTATITVTVTDAEGRTASDAFELTVNAVDDAPKTNITSGPSGPIKARSATFEFSSEPAEATFECRLDGGQFAACSSPKSYTRLADGQHTFQVKARDAAGNIGATAERSFTVDTAPLGKPTVDLDASSDTGMSQTDNITNDNTLTFTGTAEANSTVEVYDGNNLLGAANAGGSGNWSFTVPDNRSLADGNRSIRARAKDAAGNASAYSGTLRVTVDRTAPVVRSVSPTDGATNIRRSTNVTATFSENVDPATLRGAATDPTNPTFTLVKDGTTTPVDATVSARRTTATLDPANDLEAGVTYIATIKGGASGVKDVAGNELAQDKEWRFKTGT